MQSFRAKRECSYKVCFLILTINDNSNILSKETINVEFIRFDYDIEKAAKAVEESPCQTNTPICCAEVIKQFFISQI
jgi:hypothetical protein